MSEPKKTKVITLSGEVLRKMEVLQQKLNMGSLSRLAELIIGLKIDYIISGDLDVRLL